MSPMLVLGKRMDCSNEQYVEAFGATLIRWLLERKILSKTLAEQGETYSSGADDLFALATIVSRCHERSI